MWTVVWVAKAEKTNTILILSVWFCKKSPVRRCRNVHTRCRNDSKSAVTVDQLDLASLISPWNVREYWKSFPTWQDDIKEAQEDTGRCGLIKKCVAESCSHCYLQQVVFDFQLIPGFLLEWRSILIKMSIFRLFYATTIKLSKLSVAMATLKKGKKRNC